VLVWLRLRRRELEVDSEIAPAVGVRPDLVQAHPALERLQLLQRRARYQHAGRVAGVQVGEVRELVNEHRATVTALLLVRAEHEVVEDELVASLEELKHPHCSVGTLEAVASAGAVARLRACRRTGVALLLRQQLLGRTLPFLLRDDLGEIHRAYFA
jgi:hypothetical protein